MDLDKIITHGGGSHRDEFLACCLLISECAAPIERRDPTEDELADPRIAVVDIGHRHEPELSNFDHHQFPRDATPTCALSLVLMRLGLYEHAKQFCDWLESTERFDCLGPKETGEWIGVTPEQMRRLDSPIDPTILRLFAAQREHRPGEPLWEVMRAMGTEWAGYVRGMAQQLEFLAKHGELWTIEADGAQFEVFAILERNAPLGDSASGVGFHLKALGKDDSVVAIAYPDNRSEGHGLRRFNDSATMEFTRVSEEADVHFTHARGFIAKTSATSAERLKELLGKAWVGPLEAAEI
ncbi:MYG1 family protein [Cerasicoccus fimbriatus]|uniref:MYG1 family protein n=1 Tax=Cerasicoccus fimbriatus TaxID=3014554 RepID=UPI0022B5BFFC|nr:MYG1 family protein [Cerasicoccus sp. TK19100]